MHTIVANEGVSQYTNVGELANEVITSAPVAPAYGCPAIYAHIVPEGKGARLVAETVDPEGGVELLMHFTSPAKCTNALEYLVRRVQACGIRVLNSRHLLQGEPEALAQAA